MDLSRVNDPTTYHMFILKFDNKGQTFKHNYVVSIN